MSNIKRIAIFGSTGSIGTQALDVIAANTDKFSAEILTAQTNDVLLIKQALQFNPNCVVIGDERKYDKVKQALSKTDIKVFTGEQALEEVACMDCYDMMLAAIVGYAGLKPTLKALDNSKPVALANKETLVVAGDIVMQKAMENRVPVIPVELVIGCVPEFVIAIVFPVDVIVVAVEVRAMEIAFSVVDVVLGTVVVEGTVVVDTGVLVQSNVGLHFGSTLRMRITVVSA